MSRSRLAVAVSLVVLGVAAPTAAAQVALTACSVAPGARCGALDVPLDASGAVPGTQRIGFALLPATRPRTGTLAILLGGPGQAGTTVARSLDLLLAGVRRDHDLLIVDQRGTGRSGPLSCPAMQHSFTARAIQRCGEQLGAARAFLTARADALDLEAVRAALGVDRLSLLGISYGTEIAGYYARLFPDRVERIVLDSPEPIEGPDALDSLRQLALPRVLREICWPPGCHSFLADNPVTGIAKLTARLRRRPLDGAVISPTGRRMRARLTATTLYALAASSDLDPFLRTRLPAAVASGLRGDAAPLLRLAAGTPTTDVAKSDVNPLRLVATNCVDDRLPWDPASPTAGRLAAVQREVASRPRAAWAPFLPTSVVAFSVASVCTAWPSTPAAERVPSAGPKVPVLVVAGREDLRTPLEDARRTAAQYPDADVLAIPDVGHSALGTDETGCAVRGVTGFLAGEAATNCARGTPIHELFPYVPAEARDLRRVPGLPGPEGRTATAIGATLLDAVQRGAALAEAGGRRSGGLRAGTLRLAGRAIVLRGYSVVRGVALTGTVPLTRSGAGHVTVTGDAAAPGRLRIRRGRLTGELGNEQVRLRVRLP
ncbi:MAG TPA: alpha/beta fold hydrolase [Solirubrobacteraceae bacterium]